MLLRIGLPQWHGTEASPQWNNHAEKRPTTTAPIGADSQPSSESGKSTRRLLQVPPSHIDRAWRDGAHLLSQACETAGGEITIDQLKTILSRGERTLLAVMDESTPVGWVVVRLDQLPNLRALHICELYAPNATFDECKEQLWQYARDNGCSEIRCAAKPAQARLYRMRYGFEPVYEVLRVEV